MPRRHRHRDKHDGGFTLLELLLVLAIASLLFALVPPLFSAAVPGARLKSEARELAATLRQARNQAIIGNRDVSVVLETRPPRYRIGNAAPHDLPDGLALDMPGAAQEGIVEDQPRRLYFYPDGSSSGETILLRQGERAYRLRVDWLLGDVALSEGGSDAR